MAERAVFLDRDDTIMDNDGYLGDPSKVKLLPGAATALTALRALGYRLIVVSNQSGVARGMFDEAAVDAVNKEMGRQLKETGGAHVDASYYCPYHPDATIPEYKLEHDWRKPKPGMLKQAAIDFRLDLSKCWMVGDMDRDIAAGAAAGCRTILLHDPDLRPDRKPDRQTVAPHFVVKTLADAARIIAREGKNPPHLPIVPVPPPAPPARAPAPPTPPAPPTAPPASPQAQVSPPVAPVQVEELRRPVTEVPGARPARIEPEPRMEVPREPGPPAPAMAATGNASTLERNLEELVIQLRQQNRHADLRPDFSLGNMAALIVQFLALAMLGLGLVKLLTLKATFTAPGDMDQAILGSLQSIAWIAGAVVMQGIVVALLVHTRHK